MRASSNRMVRAQAILEALREITGESRTAAEVAAMLGRLPGAAFHRDLAAARQMALEAGEVIAPCIYDPGYIGDGVTEPITYRGRRRQVNDGSPAQGAYILYHLMPGHEEGKMTAPMLTKAADAMTRVRNAGKYGKWQARNGSSKLDRQLAKLVYQHAESSEDMFRTIGTISDEIRKIKLSQQ